ncbi:hypothetical protein LIER_02582 [Lithospermum erythrorhizon]|uniref:Uncharacterized protein n=1 Tax=Lithospermum erythrorhizon TaxID=34254 RepID=A0AAV3NTT3_LITER
MKPVKGRQNNLPSLFNEQELEVCDILVHIDNIIKQSIFDPFSNLPTKKRSFRGGLRNLSPSLSCQHPIIPNAINSEIQTEIMKKVEVDKVENPSPASPLSFSSGEPHQKPNHCSRKRGREEYMRTIKELTQTGEILKREVKTVENYYDQLQVRNQELKAWKEKKLLIIFTVFAGKNEEIKNMSLTNNGVSSGQQFGKSAYQQQYLILKQYHYHHQYGIPDLNVSTEKAIGLQWLDHNSSTPEDPKEEIENKNYHDQTEE